MNYQGMQIRRTVYINECCSKCSGKIFRLLLGNTVETDDIGSIFQTKVVEKCECTVARAVSETVSWPCQTLDILFDQWESHLLTRAEFDAQLDHDLRQAGTKWSGKTG